MDAWKTNRSDWSLLTLVLGLGLIVAVGPLATLIFDLVTGRPLVLVMYSTVPPSVVVDPQLVMGVTGVYTGEAVYSIAAPSPAQWLWALVTPMVTAAVGVVCLACVRRIADCGRRQDPFHPRAQRAVRVLALTLFCYGLFVPLVNFLMTAMITTEIRGGEFNVVITWPSTWWTILVGLTIGVVGETIFRQGRTLVDDTAGLV